VVPSAPRSDEIDRRLGVLGTAPQLVYKLPAPRAALMAPAVTPRTLLSPPPEERLRRVAVRIGRPMLQRWVVDGAPGLSARMRLLVSRLLRPSTVQAFALREASYHLVYLCFY